MPHDSKAWDLTPEPSAERRFASATGYTSWVIVLNAEREPIVKTCHSQATEIVMMKEMRIRHPDATIIHAELNPGDHRQLWTVSEAHWQALAEV